VAEVSGQWRDVATASGLLAADGSLAPTVFARMTALATATGAINLGQGFPDTDGPVEVLDAAREAIASGFNQYPPGRGVPALRTAIADHQRRCYGLAVDPDHEVLVTAGATEAIAATVLALCSPGDEVVVLEPYYDSYAATIALGGAVRRPVPLRWPSFELDLDALAAAVTPRTRLLLLNNPHNPTGRVFTRAELEGVAELARARDLLVVTDEVYEHLTFDGRPHIPLATLPGMAERTITISSAGKTFSVTGWKIGWLHARPDLVDAVTTVKQFLTFVSGGPFQPAVATGLGLPASVFARQAAQLQSRRDQLVSGLRSAGFDVAVPEGTYFVVADASPLGVTDAQQLCLDLPRLVGVVAVPMSAFYDDPAPARTLLRFACCKQEAVLAEAVKRLEPLNEHL
jgi:N-succinyldiaminopimelate aminotransferase